MNAIMLLNFECLEA